MIFDIFVQAVTTVNLFLYNLLFKFSLLRHKNIDRKKLTKYEKIVKNTQEKNGDK